MSQQKLPLQLNDTEENISIDTILKTIPLALDVEDKIVQKLALFYFPYSVGFEIETITSDMRIFDEIPYLMENKSSVSELRFRIPNGIKGIQCLFNISIYLKKYTELIDGNGLLDKNHLYTGLPTGEIKGVPESILGSNVSLNSFNVSFSNPIFNN